MRGVLSRLSAPTKKAANLMEDLGFSAFDAEGKMKPLGQLIPELNQAFEGMTDQQRQQAITTLFGQEAMSGMIALLDSAPGSFQALTEELINSDGAAATMADTINSGLGGAIEEMMGALETASIKVGEALVPMLTEGANWVGNLADKFSELDESTQRNIVQWGLLLAAAGPVLSLFGRLTSVAGTAATVIGTVIQTLGKWITPKAIGNTVTELGKVPGAATGAGGAAALFSNPWVLAGAAAIAGISAFVLYMNNEANAPFKAHNEAVDSTNGAYQEWFDAVITGMGSIDELHTSVDEGVDSTTENYKENVQQVLEANQQVQEAIGLTQDASNIFTSLWKSNQMQVEIAGQSMTLRMQNLSDALKELGQSESEITRLNDAFQNYGTTLGTVMSNVITVTQEGKAVTEDWASANIQSIRNVATETVQRLEEKRQAEIENLNQTRENVGMEAAVYEERLAAINSSYDQQINAVSQAQANIQAILSDASNNNRAISDEEVVHILQNMQTIAEGTGQSLSQVEGVAELIGNNLSALVSTTSLDMLVQMGLIDEAMAQNIAGLEDGEAKTRLLAEALGEYSGIDVDPKEFELETEGAKAELIELQELIAQWESLTIQEKAAQIEGRGGEELQELITALGVDWNSLTVEQQTAIANAEGKEQVEETLFVLGEWQNLTLEEKQAILRTQIDSEALASAIDQRDLWNNAEFVSQLATIDTNAPEARQQIIDLINEWSAILGLPPVQIEANTNAGQVTPEIRDLSDATAGLPSQTNSNVSVTSAGVGTAAQDVRDYGGAVNEMPTEKTSSVSTNIFSTIANTIAVLAYNSAVSGMNDKTVTATTMTPSMLANTLLILGYNSASGNMRSTSATASTSTPSMLANTLLVLGYNTASQNMQSTSATASTYTPGISSNTSSVWSWISALNSTYSTSSTLTTYVDRVYRTFGSHAEGGHIDAFAEGGNLKWGGMFARGGNVPKGYMGIVGEAGPELFHVTNSGVSITPLSSNEKMEGVEGAIAKFMEGKNINGNGSGGTQVVFDIDIHDPVVREEQDIDKLAKTIGNKITKQMQLDKIMRKGSAVGFA